MTTRLLPAAEWWKLSDTEIGPALNVLPGDTRIVVVEDEGGYIVGCWALIKYVHVEGVWIAPEHRKRGRVAVSLVHGMYHAAREWEAQAVLTAALTDDVRQLIDHLGGQRLPGDHYVLPIGRA